ncbi:hypothetical protein BKA67DRAFT_539894 [Truncatella angustata]|uniref:Uncharacterized protein n=1 Tax=Truncatella angustata TaxID=152316 RepID=A0A9P8UDT0_9PEZI|nr:uncharacterized protein BKA67DRAFT_539894 [Truncatella angustata]KAH6648072.1 hypothetical protein BKA67DRAFT_539894 [Truncatella angustata]
MEQLPVASWRAKTVECSRTASQAGTLDIHELLEEKSILCGNTDALKEMTRRGWKADGPFWARFMSTLQYTQGLTSSRRGKSGTLIPVQESRAPDTLLKRVQAKNPDLPQNDWDRSATHAVIYSAYYKQLTEDYRSDWLGHWKQRRDILQRYGGKTIALTTSFQAHLGAPKSGLWDEFDMDCDDDESKLWVCLPLESPLCLYAPAFLTPYLSNKILIPMLIVWYNWHPLHGCRSLDDSDCPGYVSSTDYSFLLPLVVGGTETLIWVVCIVLSDDGR